MWTDNNTQEQLIEGILRHGPEILSNCQTVDDIKQYTDRVKFEHLDYPIPPTSVNPEHWFIPNGYASDLIQWLYDQCETQAQQDRVALELSLFAKNNMMQVLPVMKYIVDTLRDNNVIWGVGRGSSVASYVLHIIGVHKIDSIKYSIPIEEFFKGE